MDYPGILLSALRSLVLNLHFAVVCEVIVLLISIAAIIRRVRVGSPLSIISQGSITPKVHNRTLGCSFLPKPLTFNVSFTYHDFATRIIQKSHIAAMQQLSVELADSKPLETKWLDIPECSGY
jgi:hypothetical protein